MLRHARGDELAADDEQGGEREHGAEDGGEQTHAAGAGGRPGGRLGKCLSHTDPQTSTTSY